MSIQARVLEALRWTTVTQVGGFVLTWTINLLVIRLLHPEDYGLMALCLAWIRLVDLVSGLGQRVTLVQRPTLGDDTVRKIFGALVLWNLGLFALSQLVAPALAAFYDAPRLEPMVRVLAVGVLIGTAAIPATALRWREIDFRVVSLAGLAQSATVSAVLLSLALLDFGVWALVGSQLAGSVVYVAVTLIATGFGLWPDFRLRGIGPEVRFGVTVLARGVIGYFDRQIDTVLIGKLLGSVPLGAYTVAGNVARQPTRALLPPIARVAAPAFARLQHDPAEVRRYYLRSFEGVVFAFVPMMWGLGMVADDLVRVVMGERWLAAIPILQIICILLPLRAPMRIMQSTLDGLGRPDVALRQSVTTAICIPIGVTVGAAFGLLGATWGWVAAAAVALAVNLRRGLPVVGASFGDVARVAAPILGAGFAMALAVGATKLALGGSEAWLRLGASVAAGAAVYGGVTWLTNRALVVRWARALRGGGGRISGGGETPASSA